jgi:xanthine permease XanP
MLGLAVDVLPEVFAALPPAVRLFTSSSLLFGTLSALVLNLVFRMGVRRTASLVIDAGEFDPEIIERFIETQGAAWGARRDVVDRAKFNMLQSADALRSSGVATGPIELRASFDEFDLDLRIGYTGPPLELPETRPSHEDIIASEEGVRKLAGFILRRYADRVEVTHEAARTTILFHFDH